MKREQEHLEHERGSTQRSGEDMTLLFDQTMVVGNFVSQDSQHYILLQSQIYLDLLSKSSYEECLWLFQDSCLCVCIQFRGQKISRIKKGIVIGKYKRHLCHGLYNGQSVQVWTISVQKNHKFTLQMSPLPKGQPETLSHLVPTPLWKRSYHTLCVFKRNSVPYVP